MGSVGQKGSSLMLTAARVEVGARAGAAAVSFSNMVTHGHQCSMLATKTAR